MSLFLRRVDLQEPCSNYTNFYWSSQLNLNLTTKTRDDKKLSDISRNEGRPISLFIGPSHLLPHVGSVGQKTFALHGLFTNNSAL